MPAKLANCAREQYALWLVRNFQIERDVQLCDCSLLKGEQLLAAYLKTILKRLLSGFDSVLCASHGEVHTTCEPQDLLDLSRANNFANDFANDFELAIVVAGLTNRTNESDNPTSKPIKGTEIDLRLPDSKFIRFFSVLKNLVKPRAV